MYLIGAKLDFHAFMGPEGQEKHLLNRTTLLSTIFKLLSVKGRLQKEKKVKLGVLA